MAKNGTGDLTRATAMIERVRNLLVDTLDDSLEREWGTFEHPGRRRRDGDDTRPKLPRIASQLAKMAEEIDQALSESGYKYPDGERLARNFQTFGPWSFGTELQVFPPRKIVRGYLFPVKEVPSLVRVSQQVFTFLTIAGDNDLLHRDNDQFGIHYHYVLANKQRTTTMICWDTRWVSSDSIDAKRRKPRPIFHELHGEGRYKKIARPHDWGDKKRKSIRDACLPDLRKWNIEDFRCASNNAYAVWPSDAILTLPAALPTSVKKKK